MHLSPSKNMNHGWPVCPLPQTDADGWTRRADVEVAQQTQLVSRWLEPFAEMCNVITHCKKIFTRFIVILANLTNQMRVNFTLKHTYPENACEL